MHVLFVHPNFPAQFRDVAPRLAADYGWECSFATAKAGGDSPRGVRRVVYRPAEDARRGGDFCTRPFANGLGHARGVYEALKARPDVRPDLVVAHSGFGSSLYLPYLYDAPVVNFFEYFYRPTGQDLGYRPELPVTERQLLRSKTRNAMILLDLDNCQRGWCPNAFQRDLIPKEYHGKIEVIPEGIDAALYRRPGAEDGGGAGDRRLPDGRLVPQGTRVVTYVSRGFEMMRGFDVFMSAAKRIYRERPDVLFVVVGSDRVCYGGDLEWVKEKSLLRHVLNADDYDLSRFHFTGHVPEPDLARILSLSDLHVYLTVPFVPSWSLLDAMSCACVVLASDQRCVREYVRHGDNGLLCDFFDADALARQALAVLADLPAHRPLGEAARRTIEQDYSLDVCLPRLKSFFEQAAATKRDPSVLAERLVRPGTPHGGSAERAPMEQDRVATPARRSPTVPRRHAAQEQAPHPAGGAGGNSGPTTVLFCWELGSGLGHLMQILPLAEGLVRGGHRVFVAMKCLTGNTPKVFARSGVLLLQAPAHSGAPDPQDPARITPGFAHILANVGWGADRALEALACAWQNLFRLVRPDLILFDHSPTALLAARGLKGPRRALIGSGFCCPPDTGAAPLPPLIPGADTNDLAHVEAGVLARANRVLGLWRRPRLARLWQLYSSVDENFLTTFPELEQFPARAALKPRYWGPVLNGASDGKAADWPERPGKRVLAYLKRFGGLPEVLKLLAEAHCPCVVYVDGLGTDGRRKLQLQFPGLHLESDRLNLGRAARECDLAVLHAGQGATAEILLAGKPLLLLPLVLEQKLTAAAVVRLGAGEAVPATVPGVIRDKLQSLLTADRYTHSARRFADRYSNFDPDQQRRRMLARAEELLSDGPAACGPRRRAQAAVG